MPARRVGWDGARSRAWVLARPLRCSYLGAGTEEGGVGVTSRRAVAEGDQTPFAVVLADVAGGADTGRRADGSGRARDAPIRGVVVAAPTCTGLVGSVPGRVVSRRATAATHILREADMDMAEDLAGRARDRVASAGGGVARRDSAAWGLA